MVKCLSAASAMDCGAVVSNGARSAAVPLYQTDFSFYYAGGLERISAAQPATDARKSLYLAIDQMSRATRRTLSPATNQAALALLKVKVGDFDGALEAIRRAEEADSHSYMSHMARSTLYLSQGDLENAIQEFKASRALGAPEVNIAQLHSNLAAAVRKTNSSELWHSLTGEYPKRKPKTRHVTGEGKRP